MASGQSGVQRSAPRAAVLPSSALGSSAVGLVALGIAGLLAIMVMAGIANDPAAVNNGIRIASIMLLVGAALFSLLCVTLWEQRSVLNILAAVFSSAALGLLMMLALGGFFNGML